MNFRAYGPIPYKLVLLHGGPGAAGDLADVAKKLSGATGVIEALQTRFTVDELILETREIISARAEMPVILAGHSWGAWLGMLVAAKYPEIVVKLILVSSGPFDSAYARKVMTTRLERLLPEDSESLSDLSARLSDARENRDRLFTEIGQILERSDIYQAADETVPDVQADYDMFEAIWPEAANLRDSGALLQTASRVQCPVVAIHGDYDPHPADGVEKPLSGVIENFRFILLDHCGHYPWREKTASSVFYKTILDELDP